MKPYFDTCDLKTFSDDVPNLILAQLMNDIGILIGRKWTNESGLLIRDRAMRYYLNKPKKDRSRLINDIRFVMRLFEEANKRDKIKALTILNEGLAMYADAQEEIFYTHLQNENKTLSQVEVKKHALQAYHEQTEICLRNLLSLPVYGMDSLLQKERANKFSFSQYIEMFISTKLEALDQSIIMFGYTPKELLKDVDIHIRNSIAHKRYSLGEDESILLKDLGGWQSKISLTELREETEKLLRITAVLEIVHTIFREQHSKEIIKLNLTENRLLLTDKKLIEYAYIAAEGLKMKMDNASINAGHFCGEAHFKFSLLPKRPSIIFQMKDGKMSKINMSGRPAIDPLKQTLGLMQRIVYQSNGRLSKISIKITDWKDRDLGEVVSEADLVLKLLKKEIKLGDFVAQSSSTLRNETG